MEFLLAVYRDHRIWNQILRLFPFEFLWVLFLAVPFAYLVRRSSQFKTERWACALLVVLFSAGFAKLALRLRYASESVPTVTEGLRIYSKHRQCVTLFGLGMAGISYKNSLDELTSIPGCYVDVGPPQKSAIPLSEWTRHLSLFPGERKLDLRMEHFLLKRDGMTIRRAFSKLELESPRGFDSITPATCYPRPGYTEIYGCLDGWKYEDTTEYDDVPHKKYRLCIPTDLKVSAGNGFKRIGFLLENQYQCVALRIFHQGRHYLLMVNAGMVSLELDEQS